MSGRRAAAAVGGVAVLAGLVAAAVVVTRGDGSGGGAGSTGATATSVVPVETRDLVLSDDYDGELGYGEATPVTAGRSGVVTGVTAVTTPVGQGGVLFHLDLQPTVLLHGAIPAFRELSVDADPGTDITQLEQALVDLGFGAGLTVDTKFTAGTASTVTAWEKALGRTDPDGVVALGDVVFAPTDLRMAEVTADRGAQVESGAEVVQVTTTAKVATLQLTAAQVANVEAGTPVTVTLPDDTEASGTIADIAGEPSAVEDEEGQSVDVYPVTITFDDPAVADSFDSGAVTVTVVRGRTAGATAVPVLALLALSEGGYALQVADDTLASGYKLVAVEVGTIADEWAEVTGDGIEAGVDVVVPA
jgi:hypothetical protein